MKKKTAAKKTAAKKTTTGKARRFDELPSIRRAIVEHALHEDTAA